MHLGRADLVQVVQSPRCGGARLPRSPARRSSGWRAHDAHVWPASCSATSGCPQQRNGPGWWSCAGGARAIVLADRKTLAVVFKPSTTASPPLVNQLRGADRALTIAPTASHQHSSGMPITAAAARACGFQKSAFGAGAITAVSGGAGKRPQQRAGGTTTGDIHVGVMSGNPGPAAAQPGISARAAVQREPGAVDVRFHPYSPIDFAVGRALLSKPIPRSLAC
jgi:hypothetical protein